MNTQWFTNKSIWLGITFGALATSAITVAGWVIADDHRAEREWRENKEIEIRIKSSEAFEDAEATIEWSEDSQEGYTEFEIEIDELPEGDYLLFVSGQEKGVIQARKDDDEDGAEGEIEFYSDGRENAGVLDFDVLGQLVEIKQGETTVFSFTMPEATHEIMPQRGKQDRRAHREYRLERHDEDDRHEYKHKRHSKSQHGSGHHDNQREFLERHVIYLENTGVYEAGKARISLVVDEDGREFEIDLEYVPQGDYRLVVDGTDRGVITVSEARLSEDNEGETEGELEFSENPDDQSDLVLDFEIKGQVIEVFEQDQLIFRGQMD